MNPLANRHNPAVDSAARPADTPAQAPPLSGESTHALGAEDTGTRYQGELFLPGWLPIEQEPTAEQGPGA